MKCVLSSFLPMLNVYVLVIQRKTFVMSYTRAAERHGKLHSRCYQQRRSSRTWETRKETTRKRRTRYESRVRMGPAATKPRTQLTPTLHRSQLCTAHWIPLESHHICLLEPPNGADDERRERISVAPIARGLHARLPLCIWKLRLRHLRRENN